MNSTLLTPIKAGELSLKNRVVMAPLTRVRAGPTHVPNPLMAEYYSQRAGTGLIMTECTMVAADCCAFLGEGGIFDQATATGWRQVTDAVHAAGVLIIMQIWHPGRATHSAINGVQPISSSNKPIRNESTHTPKGKLPYEAPRPLKTEEMPGIVELFRKAAERAKSAGFDGVQIHGAHGYLVDQFLRDSVNDDRTDQYGGSLINRARLLLEVTDAAIGVFGAGRVAIRISPLVPFNDMSDSDPTALLTYVAQQMSARHIAFFELRHAQHDRPAEVALAKVAREHFKGVLMLNGGFDQASGEQAVATGLADAIVYGKLIIANPDLVERFRLGHAPLNPLRMESLYGGGAAGYTDYPMLMG